LKKSEKPKEGKKRLTPPGAGRESFRAESKTGAPKNAPAF
jgi:hypothetical protein